MSAPIWEGRGALKGWTVAMMGKRAVARLEGRLKGAADQPPEVVKRLKTLNRPAQEQLPLEPAAPARRARQPRPKKAPCTCPDPPAAPRREAPKRKKAADDCPPAALLTRGSRKAKLFVWFAPARKPGRRGGGLRYVGGWPTDDAAAALTAAKKRKLPAGLLYVCNTEEIIKTAHKAGE